MRIISKLLSTWKGISSEICVTAVSTAALVIASETNEIFNYVFGEIYE
jgi:hypothetical protein